MSTRPGDAGFEDLTGIIRVVEETDTITTLDLEGEFDTSLSPEISEHAHHILSDGKSGFRRIVTCIG